MDFGVSYFPTDEAIEPAELARMAEERGFESVFVTEHTHIPASRETPYPAGGELPREYWRIYDPFVALTTMAAATERIRIGDRDLPAGRARPDHHRQGGRLARPALRRALAVRRRRRLEPRGDAEPRHRSEEALQDPARAGRGLQGDLDQGGGHATTASSSTSTGSSAARRRSRSRTRRSWSAATGRRCTKRVLAYRRRLVPQPDPARRPDDRPGRGAPAARRRGRARATIPVTLQIPPRDPAVLERYERAGVTRAVHMLRAGDAADAGSRRAQARRVGGAHPVLQRRLGEAGAAQSSPGWSKPTCRSSLPFPTVNT